MLGYFVQNMRPAREVYEYKCARKRHVKGKKYRDDQRLESPSASPSNTERKKKDNFTKTPQNHADMDHRTHLHASSLLKSVFLGGFFTFQT